MQGLSWFGFATEVGVVVVMVVIDLSVTLDTTGLEESGRGVIDDGVDNVFLTPVSFISSTTLVIS